MRALISLTENQQHRVAAAVITVTIPTLQGVQVSLVEATTTLMVENVLPAAVHLATTRVLPATAGRLIPPAAQAVIRLPVAAAVPLLLQVKVEAQQAAVVINS